MNARTCRMLLLALAVLVLGARPASAQYDLGWIEGQWRWEHIETGCDSAYTFNLKHDGKYVVSHYTYQARRDSSVYRVLGSAPGVIRGQIEGEKRLDRNGDPVVWDFVQLSEDEFCWSRMDGPSGNCTRSLFRCTVVVPGREGRAGVPRIRPLAGRRRAAGHPSRE
jgi:hypothetical protein